MSEPSSRLDLDRERRIGEAVAVYFAAIEAGQPPDRAAILAAYPDLAADLAVEQAGQAGRTPTAAGPAAASAADRAGLVAAQAA